MITRMELKVSKTIARKTRSSLVSDEFTFEETRTGVRAFDKAGGVWLVPWGNIAVLTEVPEPKGK